ncbi:MAG: hypothetical protein NT096_11795 [Proteobacteria bacterium]|nr:hypothetical protein [Pseudomonadota bacterium]
MSQANYYKVLTIFYSRTGKTRAIAETVKEVFRCEAQEIIDLKDRSGFWGYISGVIDILLHHSTEISPSIIKTEDYDLLFIGAPLWEGKFPPALTTFFRSAHYTGNKVILFASCGFRMKQSLFYEYSNHITKNGGEVIGYFHLRTRFKSIKALRKETENILAKNKERWLKLIGGSAMLGSREQPV